MIRSQKEVSLLCMQWTLLTITDCLFGLGKWCMWRNMWILRVNRKKTTRKLVNLPHRKPSQTRSRDLCGALRAGEAGPWWLSPSLRRERTTRANAIPLDYLGVNVHIDENRIYLLMDKYIEKCIDTLNIVPGKVVPTPMSERVRL